jgi:hypothetical protein
MSSGRLRRVVVPDHAHEENTNTHLVTQDDGVVSRRVAEAEVCTQRDYRRAVRERNFERIREEREMEMRESQAVRDERVSGWMGGFMARRGSVGGDSALSGETVWGDGDSVLSGETLV